MAVGDYDKEEMTEEEKTAMTETEPEVSEEPAEEKTEALPETEQAAEPEVEPESAPEEKGEKEPIEPVQKRINQLTFEKKEYERKLTLIKELGQEKFFEMYPEEAPQGYKPQQKEAPAYVPPEKVGMLTVNGGEYDGMTLNDVYQIDPAYAKGIHDEYNNRVQMQRKVEEEKQTTERLKQESVREVNNFADVRAQELFGKDVDECSDEERKSISALIESTLNFSNESKKALGNIEKAYQIMKREQKVAREKAAKDNLDKVVKDPVKSIGSGKVSGTESGYDGMLGMTESQMILKIERMSDGEFGKFMKEAPESVREKFKGLPWK